MPLRPPTGDRDVSPWPNGTAHCVESFGGVERAEILGHLETAIAEIADSLPSAPRGADVRVRPTVWTVAETIAHLAGSFCHYNVLLAGEQPQRTFAELELAPEARMQAMNDWTKTYVGERSIAELKDRLAREAATFITSASAAAPCTPVDGWTRGQPVTTVAAEMLADTLAHGRDVARATGHHFVVPESAASAAVVGTAPAIPQLGRRPPTRWNTTWEVRVRGRAPFFITAAEGLVSVSDQRRPRDCRITADPTAYLLLGFGRIGVASAVFSGGVRVAGRRPWSVLRLARLLPTV